MQAQVARGNNRDRVIAFAPYTSDVVCAGAEGQNLQQVYAAGDAGPFSMHAAQSMPAAAAAPAAHPGPAAMDEDEVMPADTMQYKQQQRKSIHQ